MKPGLALKILSAAALAFLFAVSLPACAQSTNHDHHQRTRGRKIIEENSNGQVVEVRVGDEVVIELPAQMGTGFSWRLQPVENSVIVSQGEPTLKSAPGQAPGNTEHQLFRFKVQSSGTATIRLQYVRPWEKEQPPQKSFQITLKAQ